MRPLRLALMGSRGIPGRYGGYETLMEELSVRLAQLGQRTTVYCRAHYTPRQMREHRGVELVVLPTLRTKYLDTPAHTLLSCLHAAQRDYDAALMVNSANALFVPLLRAAEIPTALHVDGIERRRAKWGRLGRAVYRLSERLATSVPDALITDAESVRRYYLERWNTDSTVITYGVEPRYEPPGEAMKRLGLEPRRYFLYVSRFEPENNPHRVAEAYRQVPGDLPLVMVGDAPYASRFIRSFKEGADPRILFPGAIYGRGYRELLSHALVYIHGTEVGGTHPALVEAMGYRNCVLVNDTPENREVAGDTGFYYRASDPASLTDLMEQVLEQSEATEARRRESAQRALDCFSWEGVVARYLDIFRRLQSED